MFELHRVRAEVEQFYAEHFHLLDAGDADAWAATFTPDGTFRAPTSTEPVRGRDALAAAVRRTAAELAAAGVVHRHWHGMVAVAPRTDGGSDGGGSDGGTDGAVLVRCYALVFATPRGGAPSLHRTCVCEDVLVRSGGRWLVASRAVTRDDMVQPVAAGAATG